MKRNELKQAYYKDTLERWKDENGKPTEDYTRWIENQLMKQLEKLCKQ